MIRHILVASDGSPISAKAVAYAADLAQQLGASMTVLGVLDPSYLVSPGVSPDVSPSGIAESTEDIMRQAIEAYLDEAVEESQQKGVQAVKSFRKGHPVEEIVKGAESEKADLIVLGSHGRSALRAAMLGSVAYGVLHKDARIPVLVVRR
jgi:nucleotide-binding universal stress UspA family protein